DPRLPKFLERRCASRTLSIWEASGVECIPQSPYFWPKPKAVGLGSFLISNHRKSIASPPGLMVPCTSETHPFGISLSPQLCPNSRYDCSHPILDPIRAGGSMRRKQPPLL